MIVRRSHALGLENTLHTHLRNQKSIYILVIMLFIGGLVFGALVVNSLDLVQKDGLTKYMHGFFQNLQKSSIADPQVALQYTLGDHLKTLGLIWILGLSVIGVPLLLVFIFLKGMVFGFTTSFLFSQYSWQGLGFVFVGIVPQNMIIVPIYIILAVAGVNFAVHLVKNRLIYHRGEIYPNFLSFSMLILCALVILVITALFEAYISPILMQNVAPFIK